MIALHDWREYRVDGQAQGASAITHMRTEDRGQRIEDREARNLRSAVSYQWSAAQEARNRLSPHRTARKIKAACSKTRKRSAWRSRMFCLWISSDIRLA